MIGESTLSPDLKSPGGVNLISDRCRMRHYNVFCFSYNFGGDVTLSNGL